MSKKSVIILSIISLIIVLLTVTVFVTFPKIKINGKENITLNLNEKYIEKNATSKAILGKTKILKTNDKVNTKKIGTYKLFYKTNYLFFNIVKTRTVNVVDKTFPEIILEGDEEVYVCPNKEYEELGYKALDNYDGDLTSKVKIEKSDNIIKYKVTDSSNNVTIKERKIRKKDITKPEIILKGSSSINITIGNSYSEPGYSASDNCDGDLTKNVVVSGTVNQNKVGTYEIKYTVKDSSGNEITEIRKVTVKNKIQPPKTTFTSSMVYLTFDDGPSTLTPKILDILKEENVKATFFVIGKSDSLNYIIKRAYDEGHTIALHSYSHNYKSIYSSPNAYFDDLYKIRNKVKSITGYEPNIIRFPGGSSNTVSNFNKGIMSTLSRQVTEKGFRYFDWNISSGDAGETKNSSTIYNNVIKGVSPNKTNIVLMHDAADKTYTLNALKDIIRALKNAGYKFGRIDNNTPQVVHKINN